MRLNSLKDEIERGEQVYQQGEVEEALAIFESVLAKDPDNISALNDKGVVLNKLGKYQEAIQVFSEVLNKDDTESGDVFKTAVFNLISNYFLVGNWRLAKNIFLVYGDVLSRQDAEIVRKEIEKIKGDNNRTSQAEMMKDTNLFDYKKIQESVKKALRKNLFFIIGAPKSGTTWLQYLLNGHPEIFCSGEGDFNLLINGFEQVVNDYNSHIESINKNIGTTNYAMFTKSDLQYLFVNAVGLLLTNLDAEPNVKCIGSKNPILTKNFQVHASLLPNAKFIHIIREGRDVVVSAWFNNLRGNREDTLRRWRDFHDFVNFGVQEWVSDVQKARVFGIAYPDRYFELRYEDLHTDPNPIIQQILDFLEVDSSFPMVDRCRLAGNFKTVSEGRIRGQEDRNSFFRKGIMGDWKNHFDQDCLDTFMQFGADLLRDLGYE